MSILKKILVLSIAIGTPHALARADAIFNIWVEAPAEVVAGETFEAAVWGEVSGSVLDEGDGAMYIFHMDFLAAGVGAAIAPADVPHFCEPRQGEQEENSLRGVFGLQGYYVPGCTIWTQNPILLFQCEVTADSTGGGNMELSVAPVNADASMLGWWVDYRDSVDVHDTDPGSTRIITPAVVNVVPAPGVLGLLVLAGIGARRGRRR